MASFRFLILYTPQQILQRVLLLFRPAARGVFLSVTAYYSRNCVSGRLYSGPPEVLEVLYPSALPSLAPTRLCQKVPPNGFHSLTGKI